MSIHSHTLSTAGKTVVVSPSYVLNEIAHIKLYYRKKDCSGRQICSTAAAVEEYNFRRCCACGCVYIYTAVVLLLYT